MALNPLYKKQNKNKIDWFYWGLMRPLHKSFRFRLEKFAFQSYYDTGNFLVLSIHSELFHKKKTPNHHKVLAKIASQLTKINER